MKCIQNFRSNTLQEGSSGEEQIEENIKIGAI